MATNDPEVEEAVIRALGVHVKADIPATGGEACIMCGSLSQAMKVYRCPPTEASLFNTEPWSWRHPNWLPRLYWKAIEDWREANGYSRQP